VTGLGGGTGTGATPVVARLAREAGALTLGFCTLPFFFEGAQRRLRAEEGLQELRKQADAVVVLPNQRLLDWVEGDTGLVRAFRVTDRVVGSGIRALWKLLTVPGLINLDFMDLKRMVENSGGTLSFSTAEAEGQDRVDECLRSLVECPLLEHGRVLQGADSLLVGVVAGPDFALAELEKLMNGLTAQARPEVDLHMGTSIDVAAEGRLAVTLLASERPAVPPPPPVSAPPEGTTPDAKPAETKSDESGKKPGTRAATTDATKVVQGELVFESGGRGRFRNIEPTLHEGTDLDVPTFLRRGIKLMQLP
jgi:cell division protein FtsZ